MNEKILDTVDCPDALKLLNAAQLEVLAGELREYILEHVSINGGHLASNLGAVELTLALHYVFHAPDDRIVWDVGHQSYAHKILTGRREFFKTLRQFRGCCGFPSPDQSPYDSFIAGHAGTAISAALGMAAARDLRGGSEKVVAVVGDGSLNCGISLEGLNNVRSTTKDLIIILNDNKMSISPNVGAIPTYLSRMISGRRYNTLKSIVRKVVTSLPGGARMRKVISRIEEATKSLLVPGVFFEELGIRYVGPVNGHDLNDLIHTFSGVKDIFSNPTLIHVVTEKGHGYQPATKAPEKFHGMDSFDPETGGSNTTKHPITYSKAFGNAALELAERYPDSVFITAAMKSGTALSLMAEKYPDRFFDTGIAEEHAVVFAAGLAKQGSRPVVAVYATFAQRALDCIYHDVCLQKLPVIFCLDRSGIVADGPTHHGIYDNSFLMSIPNLSIACPASESDLTSMLFAAYEQKAPVVIRYPRGFSGRDAEKNTEETVEWGKSVCVREGSDIALWAVGKEMFTALKCADELTKHNISAKVVDARFLRPFDREAMLEDAWAMHIATIEDLCMRGGLASVTDELLIDRPHHNVLHFGWSSEKIIAHGDVDMLKKCYKLDYLQITYTILEALKTGKKP